MRSKRFLSLLSALVLTLAACGGSKQMVTNEAESPANDSPCPSWYNNIPTHQDTVYAVATAVSRDLQLAIDKATMDARANIGAQVQVQVKRMGEGLVTEVRGDDDLQLNSTVEKVIQNTVNISLSGSRVMKQNTKREEGVWRACVLMSYPIGAANAIFVENLKRERIYQGRQDLRDAVDRMNQQMSDKQ